MHVDGDAVKSCCLLAVQVDGASVRTIEGITGDDGELTPLQQAFSDHHGEIEVAPKYRSNVQTSLPPRPRSGQ